MAEVNIFCDESTRKNPPQHIIVACSYNNLKINWHSLESLETHSPHLIYNDGILSCHFDGGEVYFDLVKQIMAFRSQKLSLKTEPLGKALGLGKKNKASLVIDCTFGTGKDSCYFLQAGFAVCAYERQPLVYLLGVDAIWRLKQHPIGEKLNIELKFGEFDHASSIDLTSEQTILFYDPMFEEIKIKKSLPRKEMQLFSLIVGADEDRKRVIENLIKMNFLRLIVKSPDKHENISPLSSLPGAIYKGKAVNYHVYFGAKVIKPVLV